MKPLIAYYSRRGKNLVNGTVQDLPVGNTELLATILQKLTDGDIYRIEAVEDYSQDYYRCIDQARRDLRRGVRPELKHPPDSIAAYDVIYLGYPIIGGPCRWPCSPFWNGSILTARPSGPSVPMREAGWAAVSGISGVCVPRPVSPLAFLSWEHKPEKSCPPSRRGYSRHDPQSLPTAKQY